MSAGEIFLGIFAGVQVTLAVALYALLFAVPFALIFGILQYLSRGYARFAVTAAIEFWRSSSAIVLLFVFFYVLPFVGLPLGPYTVAAMVLGLNMGGYGSQVVRGALAALDRGQLEAARALGMSRFQALVTVELPQAFRQMLPTFINELVELIKLTALVSLITLADPTFRAKQIFQITYQPAVIYTCLLLIYFMLGYPIARVGKRLERRFAKASVVPK
jgi:polar amino acid transport system permease protein